MFSWCDPLCVCPAWADKHVEARLLEHTKQISAINPVDLFGSQSIVSAMFGLNYLSQLTLILTTCLVLV